MKSFILYLSFTIIIFNTPVYAQDQVIRNQLKGINLAGAEFGPQHFPGRHGKDYLWPTTIELEQYSKLGFELFRIPFRWERIQPELYNPLDNEEISYLDDLVSYAGQNNIKIILDIHNYGTYHSHLIGSEEVPTLAFVDLWKRLASRYIDFENVILGTMNEPHKHTVEDWFDIAQATIYGIRSIGSKHLILISGAYWSGAHNWTKKYPLSNGEVLKYINDPLDNYAFDMHQYFDKDNSGTAPNCVNEVIGIKRLQAVTAWLYEHNQRAYMTEFGVSQDETCLAALEKFLNFMEKHKTVWNGWTYWAASKWFGEYMFDVYPPDINQHPQLKVLSNSDDSIESYD